MCLEPIILSRALSRLCFESLLNNSQVIAEALDIEEIGEPFTDFLTKHVVLHPPQKLEKNFAHTLPKTNIAPKNGGFQ